MEVPVELDSCVSLRSWPEKDAMVALILKTPISL